jgi:hypothetical protein
MEPRTGTPADFARALSEEIAKWTEVMRSGNIKLAA